MWRLVALLVATVLATELFLRLRTMDHARSLLRRSQEGAAILASKTLSDSEKERALRRSAAALFVSAAKFLAVLVAIGSAFVATYALGLYASTGGLPDGLPIGLSDTIAALLFAMAYAYLRTRWPNGG